jgi:uncharacterized membrane protein
VKPIPERAVVRVVVFRSLFALFFVGAGIAHFVFPDAYARIVPPLLPQPKVLVLVSGIAEIAGGIGILVSKTRRMAAFGLVILLIAVFPANINMAVAHVPFAGLAGKSWLQWLRLPLQAPLIWWAWQYTRKPSQQTSSGEIP